MRWSRFSRLKLVRSPAANNWNENRETKVKNANRRMTKLRRCSCIRGRTDFLRTEGSQKVCWPSEGGVNEIGTESRVNSVRLRESQHVGNQRGRGGNYSSRRPSIAFKIVTSSAYSISA